MNTSVLRLVSSVMRLVAQDSNAMRLPSGAQAGREAQPLPCSPLALVETRRSAPGA